MTRQPMMVVAALVGGCLCLAQAQSSSKKRIEAFAKLTGLVGIVGIGRFRGTIGWTTTKSGTPAHVSSLY